jgi:hypothetical protein
VFPIAEVLPAIRAALAVRTRLVLEAPPGAGKTTQVGSIARRLRAAGLTQVQLVELDDRLGGTARQGESPVTRFPWGAHYVTAPLADDTLTIGVLDELGAIEGRDALGHPIISERFGCREPDERLCVDGRFHEGLTPPAALDPHDEHDLRRFEGIVDELGALVDATGAPAFALPRARSSRDAVLLGLDRLSFREFLQQQGLTSPHLHWLCDYAVRDDDGVDIDEASAWAGLFYFCARRRPGVEERGVVTWPEGNGALVTTLARHLPLPALVDHAVVDIRATGGGALVTVLDRAGALRALPARHVVVATPRFVAARLVEPLRRAPPAWLASFSTSAWVTANVHLRERPKDMGLPFAWDTVALDSATPYGASLGYVNATHQQGRDHGPTVWTWYLPLTGRAPAEAFLAASPIPITLIAGNHDARWPASTARSLHLAPFFFHHGDTAPALPPDALEIIGHHHPAYLHSDGAGTRLKLPALVAGPRRLILPAFSPWAAGTPWNDRLLPHETLWAATPKRVFAIPPTRSPASRPSG